MKNITIKKLFVFLLVTLLIVSISSACYALSDIQMGQMYQDANAGDAGEGIQDVTSMILGIAQVIGVAVAVVILVVLAIKYIAASPAEKADVKKSALVYVVGVVLLFGGVAVLNIIQDAGREVGEQVSGTGYVYQERA